MHLHVLPTLLPLIAPRRFLPLDLRAAAFIDLTPRLAHFGPLAVLPVDQGSTFHGEGVTLRLQSFAALLFQRLDLAVQNPFRLAVKILAGEKKYKGHE